MAVKPYTISRWLDDRYVYVIQYMILIDKTAWRYTPMRIWVDTLLNVDCLKCRLHSRQRVNYADNK